MNAPGRSWSPRVWIGGLAMLATLASMPGAALGGVEVFQSPDHSLELGLRIQPRMEYTRVGLAGGGSDGQRDFMIRRTRIKASGKMLRAAYSFEWKLDGTDQIGASPAAQVENAYIQYPLRPSVELRVGLYDQPFSRDRLTSDSRQLAVDRGEVSNVPDALGLADNAFGFEFRGRMKGGRAVCALGMFDNRFIPGPQQDVPMLVGRLDLNLGSTKDIYQDAHFGKESWYSLGFDGNVQNSIQNTAGADDSSNAAVGIDGMIDVPFGSGRLFVKGELDAIRSEKHGSSDRNDATVRMIGAGYLFAKQRIQPFIRFDQVRGDTWARGGIRDVTLVGANFYQRHHSFKVQADIRLQAGTHDAVDGARLQSQVEF